MKLGPKSRKYLFIGYPVGSKGDQVHDRISGQFFTLRDVIFDENAPGSDDDSTDVDPMPYAPDTLPIQAPNALLVLDTPVEVPNTVSVRCEACCRVPTAMGEAYQCSIASANMYLTKVRSTKALRAVT